MVTYFSPLIPKIPLEYQPDVQAIPHPGGLRHRWQSCLVGLRGGTAYAFNVKAEDYNGEPHIAFFAGVLFEWSALDHVGLEDSNSKIDQDPFTGDGERLITAYDYFHLNSAANDPPGNYLVFSRHPSTIYLISAYDGSALWRLNGKNSTFDLQNLTFSCQHDLILHT
ncbi:uncharacterized protein K441DRAFT_710225 [Cenococcum geophilum 1.58]|uniref:uncharacterized protein n=1 Tax=Cenococcum geophilum 1.58 TaxID=794803 RepID=UPI0035900269|nr:hypothetical protein K441DRAFT_710225 [Cenococcum geophilum 1.58]